MNASLPSSRYERKFLPEGLNLAEILALVRRHPAVFREVYSQRTVNNLYLDTPGLSAYRHHVDGAAARVKHRIRWYGSPTDSQSGMRFEVKVKQGTISGKTVHNLAGCLPEAGMFNGELKQWLASADLPDSIHLCLAQLRPVLFNTYSRRYFLSADGRFRLTLDSRLQFGSELHLWRWESEPHAGYIMELKYSPQHAQAAACVTNEFPFRVARCSKYVLGIEQLGLAR